jgi:hypothetical protein
MSLFFLLIALIKHTNELLMREEHKEELSALGMRCCHVIQ